MSIAPGSYSLGPSNGKLLVHTGRSGAAAKAGHDLTIEVTDWSGQLDVGAQSTVELRADAGSLRVLEGRGGIQALGEDDKASIRQSIDEEVLKRSAIAFRSDSVEREEDRLRVRGSLEMLGTSRPLEFELRDSDGRLTGEAVVTQTTWGIKPFSILFGTLKVADEVRVTVDAELSS